MGSRPDERDDVRWDEGLAESHSGMASPTQIHTRSGYNSLLYTNTAIPVKTKNVQRSIQEKSSHRRCSFSMLLHHPITISHHARLSLSPLSAAYPTHPLGRSLHGACIDDCSRPISQQGRMRRKKSRCLFCPNSYHRLLPQLNHFLAPGEV